MALMATGIPVHHSRNMMHYKLLTISYEDAMVALGGSANMTKAAWSKNDEFISMSKDQPVTYQAQARFNALLEKCVRTTPSDLTLTKGYRYSSEPTENGSQNTQERALQERKDDLSDHTMDRQIRVYTYDARCAKRVRPG
ncbi:Phospholipase D-like domain [Phytophthora cactorum]|nr:Phospholipase D-like domain [Phytophthora cactorum]